MSYKARYCFVPELDWHFYEIKRSPGELPFTVLVENFSLVGHRQFFCDIFVSKEWDEGRSIFKSPDIDVMFTLWDYFGLKEEYGPFTPFYISFPPSTNQEPKVYRRTIEQVWDHKVKLDPSITSKIICY
jgi:hypothetical protein